MRHNVLKHKSTKPERIFYEVLKELRIPFRHRWIINGREVDFIIGIFAIEIDGHEQDGEKNRMLAELGYVPIHLNNSEITKENIRNLINKLCL
jgi:very-short-patch-repair endonuclease